MKMKWRSMFPVLATAGLAVGIAQAQQSDQQPRLAQAKAELFAPRFHATGRLSLVRPLPKTKRARGEESTQEEVLANFGAGALAEQRAFVEYAKSLTGGAPVVVKRVFTHYRCPKRALDSGGSPSDTKCKPLKVSYTPPASDPTDRTQLAECNVSVDVDVLYLGRRMKTVSWELDPVSPMTTTNAGVSVPRMRLLDRAFDPSGDEVRGITFSDNNDFPRERGNSGETSHGQVFDLPITSPDGQRVEWIRAVDQRREVAKLFYYAVVLQAWSETLQDYVFCKPYDPTIPNRGN